MKISYTYSPVEYEAIHRSRRRNRKLARLRDAAVWLLILANLGIGVVGLWLYFQSDGPLQWFHVANLLIGLTILAAIYLAGPIFRQWYLNQQMINDRQVSVETVDDGLIAIFGENRTHTKWPGVIRADEDASHFVLWINKLQAYSIPKNAFSNEEEAAFRALVRRHVEDRTF